MKFVSILFFICLSHKAFSQFDLIDKDTSKYASYRLSVRIANNRINTELSGSLVK